MSTKNIIEFSEYDKDDDTGKKTNLVCFQMTDEKKNGNWFWWDDFIMEKNEMIDAFNTILKKKIGFFKVSYTSDDVFYKDDTWEIKRIYPNKNKSSICHYILYIPMREGIEYYTHDWSTIITPEFLNEVQSVVTTLENTLDDIKGSVL